MKHRSIAYSGSRFRARDCVGYYVVWSALPRCTPADVGHPRPFLVIMWGDVIAGQLQVAGEEGYERRADLQGPRLLRGDPAS